MLHGLIGAIEDREQEDGSHSIRPLLLRHRMKAFAFCLSVRGFVSLPVRETFALDTLKSNCRTFPVADIAGVPFEIPFREIARQMGFADRMMRAEYGAFHKAETTFRSVGMRKATKLHEFICRVVHGAMIGELFSYFRSEERRVGKECA